MITIKYKLKDIADVTAGNSAPGKDDFSPVGVPFIRAGSLAFLTNGESIEKCEKIDKQLARKNKLKLFPRHSVIFAKSGMSAKMGRVYELPTDAYVVSHLAVLQANTNIVNPSFLKYYFTYRPPFHLIRDDSYPSIKLSDIEQIEVDLPDITTQNKIVTILNKASSLIKKREDSIEILEELIKATFVDMFGDPVVNPRKWTLTSFSKVGEFKSGGTPSKNISRYWEGEFPWVSPKDMKTNYIADSIDHVSEVVFNETSLKRIDVNNILIVVRGMILTHSFPVALSTVQIAINQDMKAITPNKNYTSEYLLYCLILMKEWILQHISTAAHGTKKLNAESLRKIMIPCPPLDDQARFERISKDLKKLNSKFFTELFNAKNLFSSISQKAFNGQLSFNIEIELDALIREIDLLKKDNDLSKIVGDITYLQRLVDKLNGQDFKERDLYDKAKHGLFQLMAEKEEDRKVTQEYDKKSKSLKLALK